MLNRALSGSKKLSIVSLICVLRPFFLPVSFPFDAMEYLIRIKTNAINRGKMVISEIMANGFVISKINSKFSIAAIAQMTEMTPKIAQVLALNRNKRV